MNRRGSEWGRVRRRLDAVGSLISVAVGKLDYRHFLLDTMAGSTKKQVERINGLVTLEREKEKGAAQETALCGQPSLGDGRLPQCGEGGRLQKKQHEWMRREVKRMAKDREGQ